MERLIKVFRIVSVLSMTLTITVAAASMIGIAVTGFYPAIIVLLLLTLVPMMSNFYSKKIISRSNTFQRNYYITFIFINLLTMLVVSGITFVVLVDRVFASVL